MYSDEVATPHVPRFRGRGARVLRRAAGSVRGRQPRRWRPSEAGLCEPDPEAGGHEHKGHDKGDRDHAPTGRVSLKPIPELDRKRGPFGCSLDASRRLAHQHASAIFNIASNLRFKSGEREWLLLKDCANQVSMALRNTKTYGIWRPFASLAGA